VVGIARQTSNYFCSELPTPRLQHTLAEYRIVENVRPPKLRIVPEVRKAFQVDIRHMDRLVIARYQAGNGYFRRHRDNGAPTVMFRQFALSLNLNTDEYYGGHLTFPEYNSHVYSPPAGGGIVFSASLLHEALPVTSGTRYVLLTRRGCRDAAVSGSQAASSLTPYADVPKSQLVLSAATPKGTCYGTETL
jgi:2OG-Fe(II) oxygenase superfamily